MPTFEAPLPLLTTNTDLPHLAAKAPEKMSGWFDTWASLHQQGGKDARVREVAAVNRIGYQSILDHAAAQIGTGGKR
jgi:hypothetical protein